MHLRPTPRRIGPPKTRGLALITVLWLISLLTVLATAVLAITRNHGRIAARAAQIIAAETLADSAIRLTLLQINAPLNDERPFAFSARWPLRLFDQTVNIRVEREAGRVDLNATDASLLAAVFTAGGINPERSRSFASRIIDWRDADDQPGPGGAEIEDYQRANLSYGPRNSPFESVGELRQVLGLADLSAELLDAFTVYSTRSPTIVLEFAQPLVHGALTRLSNGSVDTNSATPGPQLLMGQVARIHACTEKDAITLCRVAVARLTGSRLKPFLMYAWYTERAVKSN